MRPRLVVLLVDDGHWFPVSWEMVDECIDAMEMELMGIAWP